MGKDGDWKDEGREWRRGDNSDSDEFKEDEHEEGSANDETMNQAQ